MRILVVEDEASMRQILRDGLRENGFTVMTAADGEDALQLAAAHEFEVIVLDILLPRLNGLQVTQHLRRRATPAAILMLTACDDEEQIIEGLNVGADDYLTKPFAFPELLARLRSITRRPPNCLSQRFSVDDLIFDCEHHKASRAGRALDLTRTEFALLQCLVKSAGKTVARAFLVKSVWGGTDAIGNSTLDAFINLLRSKVDAPFASRLIYTVKGVGYGIRSLQNEIPRESRFRI